MNTYSLRIKLLFGILLLGFLFVITNNSPSLLESFSSNQCANSLIQKSEDIYLHNSNLATIPGRNPIRFNNLDEYVQYTHWQRSQNINCPILSLQHSQSDSKNQQYAPSTDVLAGLSPDAPQGDILAPVTKLLDANRNDPPYNKNAYPGFDQNNQYIGLQTPLDEMQHQDINGKSPNPMDTKWGGANFTQNLVTKGYYK